MRPGAMRRFALFGLLVGGCALEHTDMTEADAMKLQELRSLAAGVNLEKFRALAQLARRGPTGKMSGKMGRQGDASSMLHRRLPGRNAADVLCSSEDCRMRKELAFLIDKMWLVLCGVFVFFMQAGFAMVEAGTCHVKHVQNVLAKNMIDACFGTIGWYLIGWSLAYGGDSLTVSSWESGTFEVCGDALGCPDGFADNGFIGGKAMIASSGLRRYPHSDTAGLTAEWFFQWAFSTSASTIVSGSVMERIHLPAYAFFSFTMSAFIYPVVVCCTWGNGWLSTLVRSSDGRPVGGMTDLAGAGVVHVTGGVIALVGAKILGRRIGRFDPKVDQKHFMPHSMPLRVLGTMVLYIGWFGFNAGSTSFFPDGKFKPRAGIVVVNTTLSAASGGFVVFMISCVLLGKYDLGGLCNGILAGLVSITAACGSVESGFAVLIGAIGGVVSYLCSMLLVRLKIDDPVDASAVHGAAGAWGLMAAALFDFGVRSGKHHGMSGLNATSWVDGNETKYMTMADAVRANTVGLIFIIAWAGGCAVVLFGTLRFAGVVRVRPEVEMQGIDALQHLDPSGYVFSRSFIVSDHTFRSASFHGDKVTKEYKIPIKMPQRIRRRRRSLPEQPRPSSLDTVEEGSEPTSVPVSPAKPASRRSKDGPPFSPSDRFVVKCDPVAPDAASSDQ